MRNRSNPSHAAAACGNSWPPSITSRWPTSGRSALPRTGMPSANLYSSPCSCAGTGSSTLCVVFRAGGKRAASRADAGQRRPAYSKARPQRPAATGDAAALSPEPWLPPPLRVAPLVCSLPRSRPLAFPGSPRYNPHHQGEPQTGIFASRPLFGRAGPHRSGTPCSTASPLLAAILVCDPGQRGLRGGACR